MKTVKILPEDMGLEELLKCRCPGSLCVADTGCSTSTPLPTAQSSPPAEDAAESVGVRMSVSSAIEEASKKHRAVFLSSASQIWCDWAPALAWFAGFLNVRVKGCCLLQTKAAWVWHSCCVSREKTPGSGCTTLRFSPPARENSAVIEALPWVAAVIFTPCLLQIWLSSLCFGGKQSMHLKCILDICFFSHAVLHSLHVADAPFTTSNVFLFTRNYFRK